MSAVADRRPMHVGALSDDELVRLARSGHEPAFDVIVRRYQAPLQHYCRRWLDTHRAEEVVQHTLMKAFLCVRDDPRPLALRPWLYRVAHNAALNAVEKKGGDWEELDENYDGVPQPPQVAEQRARFLKIVGEIEALPSRQREALLLNEFEGRCYADIAAELGTSESGVRGLLRRARRQLRETAAAVLLPIPVLRELVRSDGGRGLQVERATDLVGTVGAAGGAGAAGGLVKVAAGVLAAGTIASGGSAIQRDDDPVRAADSKAAETSVHEGASGRAAAGATVGIGSALSFAVSQIASGDARLIARSGPARRGKHGAPWLDRMEYVPREVWDPTAAEPEPEPEPEAGPKLPLAPLAPIESESEEAPAGDEEAAAEEDRQDKADAGGKDGAEKDSGSEQPPAEGEQPPPEEEPEGADEGAMVAAPVP